MSRARLLAPAFLLALCTVFAFGLGPACSCDEDPNGGGDDDGGASLPPGTVRLSISPEQAELFTDGLTPSSQRFTVEAEIEDGSRQDVSDRVSFSLSNPALGNMSGAVFSTGLIGGASRLSASLGGMSADAQIKVTVRRIVIGPGTLPADPPGVFMRAPPDAQRAPELVYPNEGALLPVNLGAIEVHYRPGSGDNTLFEVGFIGPNASLYVYLRCDPLANGCLYTPTDTLWRLIAESNRGGEPFAIQVRGTDDMGRGVGTSAQIHVSISATPVQGGLYYWTTSNGTAIMRVEFGSTAAPERFFPFNGGGCYGCHALSRNGRHMTLSRNGQNEGQLSIIDVGARQVLIGDQDDTREQFQTWNPTGDRFAGVWADGNPVDTHIRIRDGRTAAVIEELDMGFEPDHPDWSPAGDRIIFTRVTHHQTTQRPGRGGISYIEAQAGGGWSAPQTLIEPADGFNHYYPSYAPDGRFFIYDRSSCPQGVTYNASCDGDADDSALITAMLSDGGAPITLGKVNGPGVADQGETALCNTFPRWAPFVDPRHADGSGRVMWFTFSSRRAYGLRQPNGSDMWIWMAAIDPEQVMAGRDGSFAAFALPFQDLTTSNHIGQWTTQIVPDGTDGGRSDGSPDPGSDGSTCLGIGDTCNPASSACCTGTLCAENGPGIYLCRPNF